MKAWQTIFSASLCIVVTALGGCHKSDAKNRIKIGFVVKQPEEPWFQLEWKFAQKAADEKGFDLVKIGAKSTSDASSAIDNLAAQGAQGVVICTPDTRAGSALAAKARADDMKIISVDDQFLGTDGKPLDGMHHVGIKATTIGESVGKDLFEQMKARGWKPEETAVCELTFDSLDTARERTGGAVSALTATGFAKDKIFTAAEKLSDLPSAQDAAGVVFTQHPEVKHWLICGMNDSAVLGALRAAEGHSIPPADTCGIGINGGPDAIAELQKTPATGFYGSILLQAKKHGYDTSVMMYEWIKDGKEPAGLTFTDGILITRENYVSVLKDQGITN